MLTIKFNDQDTRLERPCSLARVLEERGIGEGPFAVVVNGSFVRREQRDAIVLQDGDEILILTPMSGG